MVVIKVGIGPGQTNMPILSYIHALGVYCVPGIPHTTHVSQETDQNHGLFKSVFWSNLDTLSQVRFNNDKMLLISDHLILVFGDVDHGCTKAVAEDSFSRAFSVASNVHCWKKFGAIMLT